jgi:predicted metal-dependent hydrolase
MKQIFLPNNPEISVQIRHSARARRLSLRISSLDGKVTLSGPPYVRERDYMAFIRDKEDWIIKNLAVMPEKTLVAAGAVLVYRGSPVTVAIASQRGVRIAGDAIYVARTSRSIGASIKGFLKSQARDALAHASDRYAAQLGVGYSALVLRDTRSRWGSCSSQGQLMYSWRLIMAPPDILDYVAAHEVAHLIEMNHSRAFWNVVARLYPDYEKAREWLRSHGPMLHRYDFDT